MENEEKKVCCEGKVNCEHGSMGSCCHNWKKCHMMRKIMTIVVILIAFCLGSQWGELKSEVRGSRFERGGMMNWGGYGNRFEDKINNNGKQTVGEVKVEVTKPAVTNPAQ